MLTEALRDTCTPPHTHQPRCQQGGWDYVIIPEGHIQEQKQSALGKTRTPSCSCKHQSLPCSGTMCLPFTLFQAQPQTSCFRCTLDTQNVSTKFPRHAFRRCGERSFSHSSPRLAGWKDCRGWELSSGMHLSHRKVTLSPSFTCTNEIHE